MATPNTPLWEVFIRSRNGLAHKHVGSLHASDNTLALQAARDIYTRRGEGLSIWVVPSSAMMVTAGLSGCCCASSCSLPSSKLRRGLVGDSCN